MKINKILTLHVVVLISFSFVFAFVAMTSLDDTQTYAPNEDVLQQCIPKDIKYLPLNHIKSQQSFERMCLNG